MTKQERYAKFREDMEAAEYPIIDYQGRYSYDGPAVLVEREEEQDVIRATTVRLQSDSLGMRVVLYPV